MNNEKRFCVYLYKDSEGVVFYIGSGNLQRPYTKNGRDAKILEKLENNGSIEILQTDLTKPKAIDLENSYLKEYFSNGIINWKLLNKKKSADNVKTLTYEFCSEHWYYCPTSPSFLRWRYSRTGHNGRRAAKADSKAGSINSSGYYNVMMNKIGFGVHRIIWVLVNKKELSTDLVINHIDSCRTNNLSSNLEAVTPRVNNLKRKCRDPEMLNIGWHKRDELWDIRWIENGENRSARFKPKDFKSVDEALIAAKEFRDHMRNTAYFQPNQCLTDILQKET